MSRVNLEDILHESQDNIEEHVKAIFNDHMYFKARVIARTMLERMYGLNHMIFRYELIAIEWTKKIGKILMKYVREGKLEIYSTNSRGNLYKKTKQKKEE